MQHQADNRQSSERFVPEQVDDRNVVVLLILFVLFELSLDVLQFGQSDLVLVFPVVGHSNPLQDGQRLFGSVVDDEVERSLFDIENQEQEHNNEGREQNEEISLPVLEPIEKDSI